MNNNFIKFPVILLVICFLASGLLGIVYSNTKDKIRAQEELEKELSLREVVPQATQFKLIDRGDNSFYIGTSAAGIPVGYAFVAEKKGYASVIATMVGITSEGTITGIKILSQNETPGLGSKITEVKQDKTLWSVLSRQSEQQDAAPPTPWFQAQFEGKDGNSLAGVDAITGATISSRAVIDAIREKTGDILTEIARGE